MYYTSIVLIAVAILLIENHDILFDGDVSQDIPVRERYKQFLYGVLVYYTVDALWGIFDSLRLASLLFVDTTIYFAALAAGIMLWTRFVVTYLGEDTAFSRFLSHAGQIFFAAVLAAMILNFLRRSCSGLTRTPPTMPATPDTRSWLSRSSFSCLRPFMRSAPWRMCRGRSTNGIGPFACSG